MNDCHNIQPQLTDYLCGELAAAQRAAVQAHLDGCAECRREMAELRAVLGHLEQALRVPADAPAALTPARRASILAAATGAAAAAPPRAPAPRPFPRSVAWSLAASIVLALGLTAILWLRQPPRPTAMVQTAPAAPTAAKAERSPAAVSTPVARTPPDAVAKRARAAVEEQAVADTATAPEARDVAAGPPADLAEHQLPAAAAEAAKLSPPAPTAAAATGADAKDQASPHTAAKESAEALRTPALPATATGGATADDEAAPALEFADAAVAKPDVTRTVDRKLARRAAEANDRDLRPGAGGGGEGKAVTADGAVTRGEKAFAAAQRGDAARETDAPEPRVGGKSGAAAPAAARRETEGRVPPPLVAGKAGAGAEEKRLAGGADAPAADRGAAAALDAPPTSAPAANSWAASQLRRAQTDGQPVNLVVLSRETAAKDERRSGPALPPPPAAPLPPDRVAGGAQLLAAARDAGFDVRVTDNGLIAGPAGAGRTVRTYAVSPTTADQLLALSRSLRDLDPDASVLTYNAKQRVIEATGSERQLRQTEQLLTLIPKTAPSETKAKIGSAKGAAKANDADPAAAAAEAEAAADAEAATATPRLAQQKADRLDAGPLADAEVADPNQKLLALRERANAARPAPAKPAAPPAELAKAEAGPPAVATGDLAPADAKPAAIPPAATTTAPALVGRLQRARIERLEIADASAADALHRLATIGDFHLELTATAPTRNLSVYAANVSVYDSLHLVCQAANLRLEFGDRVRVAAGPYHAEFAVGIFPLTGRFAPRGGATRAAADARLKIELAARGIPFPPGTDLRCEPDLGLVIIRHRPVELERLRALLGE